MRPSGSLLFLLLLLLLIPGVAFLLPEGKRYPGIKEFVSILKTDSSVELKTPVTTPESLTEPDSSKIRIHSDLIEPAPLSGYLDSLINSKRKVRILYYGDSQLEGDRITSRLRSLLQQKYGGAGPGLLLPVMSVQYTKSVWVRSSSNWQRFNYLSYRDSIIREPELGPMLAYCRYLPPDKTSEKAEKAWIRINPSADADSLASSFRSVRILYTLKDRNVALRILNRGNLILDDSLRVSDNISQLKFITKPCNELLIEFEGNSSPDIYGISLEDTTGVVVDNIPHRGSAGLEFTMASEKNLKTSFDLLEPEIIILQYGLNVVRNIRSNYNYYMQGMIRQINQLKKLSPGSVIIIAGVTDMAENIGDTIKPFSNIPEITKAQKSAAELTGSLFWDARKAMGGENSIIRWAESSPLLAQKDLAHLTYTGADSLGILLFQEIFAGNAIISVKDTLINNEIQPVNQVFSDNYLFENLNIKIRNVIAEALLYSPEKPLIFPVLGFWIFLFIVLIIYSLIYKKPLLRNSWLFLISLFFYYKSGGLFIILLFLIILIDFFCGLLINKSESKFSRRLFITLSLLSNLGILAYFKYSSFIAESLNSLLGTHIQVYDYLGAFSNKLFGTSFDITTILLPAGISFFTFQSLSYTIDIYRRKIKPLHNIIDFGFYVSFFPQLVAGPIVRASEFIPQLYAPYSLSKREFSFAVFLIIKGLIKKIVISDFISTGLIDRVFDAPAGFSGFENLMAVYGYGLQIYCDFSGYTDIAIGVGLLLGYRLPLNFNSPYKAAGLSDFWRRWHISLSRWLKDYMYISLGGNRKGTTRTGINIFLTMLLGGLWHGASLRFIIWGALHGAGLLVGKLISGIRKRSAELTLPQRFFAVFITFNFVNFCWIFFRASDMETVKIMLDQIFTAFLPGSWNSLLTAYLQVLMLILAGYTIHFLPEKVKEAYRGLFIRTPIILQFVIIVLAVAFIISMNGHGTQPFIYFRF